MWDVYRDLTDGTRYLVLRKRGAFPAHLIRTSWGFIGSHGSIAQDTAEKVTRNGFAIISSEAIGEPGK
jgi:hypothetical protein